MIQFLKLNLIKISPNSNINNYYSKILLNSLVLNDNLNKIRWISKSVQKK